MGFDTDKSISVDRVLYASIANHLGHSPLRIIFLAIGLAIQLSLYPALMKQSNGLAVLFDNVQ